ncbi:hypothetical protein EVAR_80780_1 [Eumeta japonica]|uniref:Uncharacterized protein n=1 Tax=Eumeta variegata TaxID=151549 RepID=A0A4C1X8E7_EUMVA|nr:hypothetical protein EVAR_80780_1 [Eumeta japonica]
MNTHTKKGRSRSSCGTVRSVIRGTPRNSLEDVLCMPHYFYHVPPQPPNTFPSRKRRKRCVHTDECFWIPRALSMEYEVTDHDVI